MILNLLKADVGTGGNVPDHDDKKDNEAGCSGK